MKFIHEKGGFTLVELLVSIVIAGVISGAVYGTYQSQQRSYTVQEQVAVMQQNLRNALYHLEHDIRMTGFDPLTGSGAGILDAQADTIQIGMDINNDADTGQPDGDIGDPNENVTYALNTVSGVQRLERNNQPVADFIDALDFVYLDGDGNVTAVTDDVRSIQITVVARTERPDQHYSNNDPFLNQQGDIILPAQADSYRRKALHVEVKCRNLGF